MQYTTVHDRQLTPMLLATAVDCCQCSAVYDNAVCRYIPVTEAGTVWTVFECLALNRALVGTALVHARFFLKSQPSDSLVAYQISFTPNSSVSHIFSSIVTLIPAGLPSRILTCRPTE